MEIALAIFFVSEYLIRLWAVGAAARYQGFSGKLRFVQSWTSLLDLLIIGATLFLLPVGSGGQRKLFAQGFVQFLRLIQMLRVFHVDRQMTTWFMLKKILKMSGFQLVSAYYIAFLLFLTLSLSVYTIETTFSKDSFGNSTSQFRHVGDALWFGIVSLLTIGYGDYVPQYWLSRLLTFLLSFWAFCMFTTASTLVGVGLSLLVQDRNKQKRQSKLKISAVRMLQCWYRCRLIERNFDDISLFKKVFCKRLRTYESIVLRSLEEKQFGSSRKRRSKIDLYEKRRASTALTILKSGFYSARNSIEKRHSIYLKSKLNKSNLLTRSSSQIAEEVANNGNKVKLNNFMMKRHSTTSSRQHFNVKSMISAAKTNGKLPNAHQTNNSLRIRKEAILRAVKNREQNAQLMDKYYVDGGSNRGSQRQDSSQLLDCSLNNSKPPKRWATSLSVDYNSCSHAEDDTGWSKEDATMVKYKTILTFIYYLKFLVQRKRFNRARNPDELTEIEADLREMEMQKSALLRQLQTSVEAVIGRPQQSLLSRFKGRQSIAARLKSCEEKLAQIEQKSESLLQLSEQIDKKMNPNAMRPLAPKSSIQIPQKKNTISLQGNRKRSTTAKLLHL